MNAFACGGKLKRTEQNQVSRISYDKSRSQFGILRPDMAHLSLII